MTRAGPALALAALALALRCYGLTAPLLDYHSWRQADTASIARNYAANGYRLPYPQVDWGGGTPGYVESEFPVYTYGLALLYGIFGTHDWLGRLLTALCGAAAVAALYGLARSGREAIYAGATLALMPFPIYFGRTVMPDTLMLLTAILAIWTFRRWTERPSAGRLAVALLCGALAPLTKTPNLVIVAVPLAYLLWRGRAVRHARMPLILYGAGFALPSLLWMWHARALPSDPQLSFGIGEKLFDLGLLADPQFYRLLASWSIEHVITLAGLPFFILGLAPAARERQHGIWTQEGIEDPSSILHPPSSMPPQESDAPWLPHAWLLGVVLFLGAGATGVVGQDYYILPLAGPAAWLVGAGLDRAQRLVERRAAGARTSWLVPALGLAALGALSLWRIAPLYQTTDFYRTLGRRLDLALPPGARVGIVAPAVSEILYYGERKGWRLDPIVVSVPGGLASLPPDHGVRYILVADPWLTEQRALLTAALRQYRRIPVGPYALLLDLEHPGQQPPAELIWETGHLVTEPFLGAWNMAGGAGRMGYPLSDELAGPEGQEQYFERGLLVRDGQAVVRAPVGRLLLAAQGYAPQSSAVDPSFHEAWLRAGGETTLGMALSPAIDGVGGQTQYFEYGTLEALPGMEPGPGASGRRLLEARGLTEERQIELTAKHET
jgi:4-amino-4-deoxy-L-arabinose transferase-like glycosyltransferase